MLHGVTGSYLKNMDNHSKYTALLTQIEWKVGPLLIFHTATKEKIDDLIENAQWLDESLDRYSVKLRRKRVAGAGFGYRKFLVDLSIIGISKTVEDTLLDIKEILGVDFNIWKDNHLNVRYHQRVKTIRALNNSVKHNKGYIIDDGKKNSAFLIHECGFQNGVEIYQLELNIPREIFCAYVFLVDLASKLTANGHPILKKPEEEAYRDMINYFIPEFLNLEISCDSIQ